MVTKREPESLHATGIRMAVSFPKMPGGTIAAVADLTTADVLRRADSLEVKNPSVHFIATATGHKFRVARHPLGSPRRSLRRDRRSQKSTLSDKENFGATPLAAQPLGGWSSDAKDNAEGDPERYSSRPRGIERRCIS
jgi:hypothetical protein